VSAQEHTEGSFARHRACLLVDRETIVQRRRTSLLAPSIYPGFGAVTLGSRPFRPSRRRRGPSASTVFAVLLLVATVEAAWFFQPLWRPMLITTVVLSEATPRRDDRTATDGSSPLLRDANEALSQGRWADASAAFTLAAERDTAGPAATISAARSLLAMHRIDESLVWARRAVVLAPDSAPALTVLATALDWDGQVEEAVAVARHAVEVAPTDARALAALAEALADLHEQAEADELIGQALARAPQDPEVYRVQGAIRETNADYAQAVEAYRRALELDPKTAHRHLSLGLALRSLGQFDAAGAACERAVDLAPSDARVYGCLGLVALAQGQINRAIPLFEWALSLDARYPTAAAQLGWIASRRGDDARAAPLFEAAVAADRNPARLAQYRQALGWSYLRLGRGPLAREQFSQALLLDPSLHSAREGLATLGTGRSAARSR
jgi:tetratricopeptide (TPR) repeat protein